MENVIATHGAVCDRWQLLDAGAERWRRCGEDGLLPDLPPHADLIVPLELWRLRRDEFAGRDGRNGIWIASHDQPEAIAGELRHFALVAVKTGSPGDGRIYSTARLLRERWRYPGELRAIGEVLIDQIYELHQCGFDSFALRADQDRAAALRSLRAFSDGYQSTARRALPLFRRRLAAVAR